MYENINHHHNRHYYHIHRLNFNRKTSTVGHNLLEPPTLNKSSCHLIGGHLTLHSLSRKEMTVHRGLHSRTIRPQRPFIIRVKRPAPRHFNNMNDVLRQRHTSQIRDNLLSLYKFFCVWKTQRMPMVTDGKLFESTLCN